MWWMDTPAASLPPSRAFHVPSSPMDREPWDAMGMWALLLVPPETIGTAIPTSAQHIYT